MTTTPHLNRNCLVLLKHQDPGISSGWLRGLSLQMSERSRSAGTAGAPPAAAAAAVHLSIAAAVRCTRQTAALTAATTQHAPATAAELAKLLPPPNAGDLTAMLALLLLLLKLS
jgi:hypothetical protein